MRRATRPDMTTSDRILAVMAKLHRIVDSYPLDKQGPQVSDHVQEALYELNKAWKLQRVIDWQHAAKPKRKRRG